MCICMRMRKWTTEFGATYMCGMTTPADADEGVEGYSACMAVLLAGLTVM